MIEDLPAWVSVPLFVILTAALLFVRRHEIAAWLGVKEKE